MVNLVINMVLSHHLPIICPICPIETFKGTARVAAPVPRKLAVSQLRSGGILEKEKDTAMHKRP